MGNEIAPLNVGTKVAPIIPSNFDAVLEYSRLIQASGLAPSSFKNDNMIAVAIMQGYEVGFTPLAALQSIAVINGRPSIWGDGALALCQSSGLMEDFEETYEGDGDDLKAVCKVKRKGMRAPFIGEFSMKDADKAKLLGKDGPWKQYTKRMLKMRARAFALRDAFADVFRGLAIAEEQQDVADAGVTVSKPPKPPVPSEEKKAEPAVDDSVEDADFETEEQIAEREAAEAEGVRKKQEAKDKRAAAKAEKEARDKAEQEAADKERAAQAANDEQREPSKEDKAARLSRLVMGVREIAAQKDVAFDSYLDAFDMMLKHADDQEVFLAMYAERRVPANADEKKRQMEMAEKHKQRIVSGARSAGSEPEAKQEQAEAEKPKGWVSKMHDAIDDFVQRSETGDEDFNPDDIFDIVDDVKEMEESGRADPEAIAALKNRLEEIVKSMG